MVIAKQIKAKMLLAGLIFAFAPMASAENADSKKPVIAKETEKIVENQKIELINRTIQSINSAIRKAPKHTEGQKLVATAKKLVVDLAKRIFCMKEEALPGCCLYQGENYLAQVVAIAEKQERVQDAINYINRVGNIDQKVCDYFENTLRKLQAGINVPLPDYFHATRHGVKSIIENQKIWQSWDLDNSAGHGTYMSTNNEGDYGYGPHAFAIDAGVLKDSGGYYFGPISNGNNKFPGLWVAVHKSIPITQEVIAFVDVANGDSSDIKELLEKQKLNIEVVDRKTSHEISRIFDETTEKREVPSFSWYYADAPLYCWFSQEKKALPKNMILRNDNAARDQFLFGGEPVAWVEEEPKEDSHDTRISVEQRRKLAGAVTGSLAVLTTAYLALPKVQKMLAEKR
jgi:hypothetical protein